MAQASDFPRFISRGLLRGRYFSTQHAYLEALARAQGRSSRYGKRVAPKSITSASALGKLSAREQATRDRALHAVSEMRRDPSLSLEKAAKKHKVAPDSIRRYGGEAVERRGGRLRAKPVDRLARSMAVVWVDNSGRGHVDTLIIRDSRTASLIGEHSIAIKLYLEHGDTSALRKFRRKYITVDKQAYLLLTDTNEIDRLRRLGYLTLEQIYKLAA
jgi:hypothetical protein